MKNGSSVSQQKWNTTAKKVKGGVDTSATNACKQKWKGGVNTTATNVCKQKWKGGVNTTAAKPSQQSHCNNAIASSNNANNLDCLW